MRKCICIFKLNKASFPRNLDIFLKTHFFYRINHSGNLFSQRNVASDSLIRVKMYVKNILGSCRRGHSSSADEFKSSGDLIPLCKVYCST